ncbi:MAG: efflux RND transporter periplasmic adaptor subunit, partial [Planctomycetes bacterium]|nr:efflux RND transporter periplasmic adaptor subunit [Planctomycetota bacterium]
RSTIARAAYEVAEQQAVVDRLESDLRKTSVVAPFAGYVTAREVESGEWLANGDVVVEIIDLSSVLVRVDVPEFGLAYVAQGDAARVKIDALQRTFDGRIKHIIRQADAAARTFPIEIELDNRESLLAGGMFARAVVAGGPKGPAVAVPKDAIVEQGGVAHVAMIVPGQQGGVAGVLSGVTVGADVGDWITIISGNVLPGMQVITRGNEHIQPFPTPVQIVDDRGIPVKVSDGDSRMTSKGGA